VEQGKSGEPLLRMRRMDGKDGAEVVSPGKRACPAPVATSGDSNEATIEEAKTAHAAVDGGKISPRLLPMRRSRL
jgi:hypothetical protein